MVILYTQQTFFMKLFLPNVMHDIIARKFYFFSPLFPYVSPFTPLSVQYTLGKSGDLVVMKNKTAL